MSDAKTIAFQSSEGFPIAADAYGDHSHDPVLFMHGGGQTRHAWGGAAAALAKHGWYTISMDHRGHGDSGWSEDANYELDYFVEDFHTVQEQIGRRMVVCGASLGGLTWPVTLLRSAGFRADEPPHAIPSLARRLVVELVSSLVTQPRDQGARLRRLSRRPLESSEWADAAGWAEASRTSRGLSLASEASCGALRRPRFL